MVNGTSKPDSKEEETSLALPVAAAAAAAVAVGTLGLVAWARSKKRRRPSGARQQRSHASSPGQHVDPPRAQSQDQGAPVNPDTMLPEGIEGEVRSVGAHIVVTDAFGPGARARVYGRSDWVAAVSGAAPLPSPAYEVNRASAAAAQLSAMAYVRAAQNEQEES